MAADLIDNWAKLKISEDENTIVDLGSDVTADLDDKLSLRLVGKLLTSKAFNVEAFKRTITQSWGVQKRVIIKAIETNFFVFQFFHWKDKEKVLAGRPWCFDQHLVVLNEITGDEQPAQISLDYSPFWVRIHNLPFNCRSIKDVTTIASSLGAVMEVENDELGLEKFCRVRLMMDVHKPLRRFQKIKNKNNTIVTIEYKYERLPFFCFLCGCMGHHEKDCHEGVEEEGEKELGWGLWLKASPRKGRTQYLAEEAGVLKGRTQLFVRKESPQSSSSTGKQLNMGEQPITRTDDAVEKVGDNVLIEGIGGQEIAREKARSSTEQVRVVESSPTEAPEMPLAGAGRVVEEGSS